MEDTYLIFVFVLVFPAETNQGARLKENRKSESSGTTKQCAIKLFVFKQHTVQTGALLTHKHSQTTDLDFKRSSCVWFFNILAQLLTFHTTAARFLKHAAQL